MEQVISGLSNANMLDELKLRKQMVVIAAVAGFVVTLLLTGKFRNHAMKKGLVDIPGSRTSHHTPTPRGGGVVFVAVVFIVGGVLYRYNHISNAEFILVVCSFLMATIGVADDYLKLPNSLRFVAQLIIAMAFLALNGRLETLSLAPVTIHFGLFAWPLCVLFIVWSVNMFNFMDGLDAFASMEAIFIFAVLGAVGAAAGAAHLVALMLILVGAMAGFLKWNFPPAKIFMGDGGSYFLGFMIAGAALLSDASYRIPFTASIMLYGIFWFDATVTLIRRMLIGEKWYLPHKSHAYQRLHQAGHSHMAVTGYGLAVNVILACLAVAGIFYPQYLFPLFVTAFLFLTFLYGAVERIKPFGQ